MSYTETKNSAANIVVARPSAEELIDYCAGLFLNSPKGKHDLKAILKKIFQLPKLELDYEVLLLHKVQSTGLLPIISYPEDIQEPDIRHFTDLSGIYSPGGEKKSCCININKRYEESRDPKDLQLIYNFSIGNKIREAYIVSILCHSQQNMLDEILQLEPYYNEVFYFCREKINTQALIEDPRVKYNLLKSYNKSAEIIIDAESGDILEWNLPAAELLGYPPGSDESLRMEDIFLFRDDISKIEFYKALHTNNEFNGILYLRLSGNRAAQCSCKIKKCIFPDKKLFFFSFIEVGHNEKTLFSGEAKNNTTKAEGSERLGEARERLESLGKISAGIAHEINQPLTALSMGLENIILRMDNKKLSEDYLRNKCLLLEEQIVRIRETIKHIRSLSKNSEDFALEEIQINELCNGIMNVFRLQLQKYHVHFNITYDSQSAIIIGNRLRMERALINLISNSIDSLNEKFGKNNAKDKHLSLSTQSDHDNGIIIIQDNGTGIKKINLSRIFDPLYTTKKEEGTGLGLPIVRQIVEDHKGSIKVESTEGISSRFILRFPALRKKNSTQTSK